MLLPPELTQADGERTPGMQQAARPDSSLIDMTSPLLYIGIPARPFPQLSAIPASEIEEM